MKSKIIKSNKTEIITDPETIINIKQEIIDFQIQRNKLQNKILERQRRLLNVKEGGFFTGCDFKNFPDE